MVAVNAGRSESPDSASIEPLEEFSVAQQLLWTSTQQTTRVEDRAYSLAGIFDINTPTLQRCIYEGNRAFRRLQEEIVRRTPDQSLFAWTSFHFLEAPFRLRGSGAWKTTIQEREHPSLLASSLGDFSECSAPRLPTTGTKGVPNVYHPRGDDLRIAVFFLLFMQVAYFGPGNFPSLASFYLDPIYRLVSKYNPYLVLVFLMFKRFAPYILLALAFSLLHVHLDVPPFRLFIIALAFADVMNLTFFLKVTHTGSWYNISQSFYNFCTSSLLVLLATVASIIGELMLPRSPPSSRSDANLNLKCD